MLQHSVIKLFTHGDSIQPGHAMKPLSDGKVTVCKCVCHSIAVYMKIIGTGLMKSSVHVR